MTVSLDALADLFACTAVHKKQNEMTSAGLAIIHPTPSPIDS
jgi:hypothetical protein